MWMCIHEERTWNKRGTLMTEKNQQFGFWLHTGPIFHQMNHLLIGSQKKKKEGSSDKNMVGAKQDDGSRSEESSSPMGIGDGNLVIGKGKNLENAKKHGLFNRINPLILKRSSL